MASATSSKRGNFTVAALDATKCSDECRATRASVSLLRRSLSIYYPPRWIADIKLATTVEAGRYQIAHKR